MSTHTLRVETREITGRKVKALRSEGIIPANVFGKDIKSYAVSVKADEFRKLYEDAGETAIVELSIDKGKTAPVLISNVQKHPVTGEIIHVDFRQVDLTKKVTAQVPVELTGESPAEKSGVGTVVQQIQELTVEALPTELPEKFEVDVSALTEVDQAICVKDLKYDRSKVTIQGEENQIIAKVEPPQKEEEVSAPAEAEAGTEGEAPATAEGEEAKPAGEVPVEKTEE